MRKATASNKRNSPSSSLTSGSASSSASDLGSSATGLGSRSGPGLGSRSGSGLANTFKHQRKSAKSSESLSKSKSDRHFANTDTEPNTNAQRQDAARDHRCVSKQLEMLEQVQQESKRWQQANKGKDKELARLQDGQGNYVYIEHRKQNHCEIEKRRRDKMNHYIMQLASVIPTFANNQSKFDKLTVLRMAVQHVKSLRSSLCSFSSFHLRPSFLSSGNLLKNLILQMASQEAQDNLFMVVSCDSGKLLFVSQSSQDILNQDQNDLVGQCLFDLLHKDDVSKVKEQISYFNLMPKQMLIDSKTLQPIKHNQRQSFSQLQNHSNSTPQPGARRSFFCRMRSGGNNQASQISNLNVQNNHLQKGSDTSNTTDNIMSNNCPIPKGKNCEEKTINDNINTTQLRTNASQLELSETTSENLSSQVDNNSDLNQLLPSMSVIENIKNCSSLNTKNNDSTIVDTNNKNLISNRKSNVIEPTNNSSKATQKKPNFKANSLPSISSDSSKAESSPDVGRHQSVSNNITGNNQASDRLSSVDISSSSKSNFKLRNSTNLRMSSLSSRSKKQFRYTVMHCTGYLKSITLNNDEFDDDDYDDLNSENNSSDDEENSSGSRTVNCLVAVCRRSPINRDLKPDRPLTFTCRYSMEGKFVFVDQRTTLALGYTPQQLLGTSHYAYCHKDSVNTFKECHRQCILKSEPVSSDIYQFKRANGQHLWLQTSLKCFRNPWTKFIDYIVANHTTAEGNDPHYNEGCVPTKFNQDMTGETSQSSSPASSSSSLPSMDSKKSSSPSSSSIGSSYSMESYASGASIQALLNQIDRIKSGGIKHALDFTRIRNDGSLIRSGGVSTRKSNEDSGNYSDPQSCSSLSSNSAICNEYVNLPAVNIFPETNTNSNPRQLVNNNNFAANNNTSYFNNNKMNAEFSLGNQNLNTQMNYQLNQQQQQQQQMTNLGPRAHQVTNFDRTLNSNQMSGGSVKIISRANGKPTRQSSGSSKQHNRIYNSHYHYKTPTKSCSSTSSDTGNESGIWSNYSGSVYSENTGQQDRQVVECAQQSGTQSSSESHHHQQQQQQQQGQSVLCGNLHDRPCKVNSGTSYVMQPVDQQAMNMAPVQVPIDTQLEGAMTSDNYSGNLMPVNSYMSQSINPRFSEAPQVDDTLQQQNISMKLDQQAAQNVPVMWSQPEAPYQNNPNSMHNSGGEQICSTGTDVNIMNMDVGNSNSQIAAQPTVCCQQFLNHKCCSNQQSTDLNGINLTSLLDNDLDEDQLLYYLAGCDPEGQLYNIQNNAFSNFNI